MNRKLIVSVLVGAGLGAVVSYLLAPTFFGSRPSPLLYAVFVLEDTIRFFTFEALSGTAPKFFAWALIGAGIGYIFCQFFLSRRNHN